MNGWRILMGLVFALVLQGCDGCAKQSAGTVTAASPVNETNEAAAAFDPGEPTRAQPKLTTIKLYIQTEEMVAELALTRDQLRTGMMFRTNMAPNTGMLFPLPYTQVASFWMKNCPLPLSAAYIDPEGVIQEIHELQPYNTNAVLSASDNIRFVLEAPQGWFKEHRIGPGVAITTERGPLMQTFFR